MKLTGKTLNNIIAGAAMTLIGTFCFFYSRFFSDFAEINIKLNFLKFPIFVGELLLIICIVLLLLKFFLSPIKLNKWHWFLAVWILFILIKALWGYRTYGALAFRNAALFYYSSFAIITYYLFNISLIKKNQCYYPVLAFLLTITSMSIPIPYYIYTCIILCFALILIIKDKFLRNAVIILFFIFLPYKSLFGVCRGALIAHFAAWIFLFIVFLSIFNFRLKYKIYLTAFLLTVFLALIYLFADLNNVKSLLNPGIVLSNYKEYKKQYSEKMIEFGYQEKELPILLYESKSSKPLVIVQEKHDDFKTKVAPEKSNNKTTAIIFFPEENCANKKYRSINTAYSNIIWRMIVYSDMWEDIIDQKQVLGVDFGKPFRSKTIETLGWNNAGQWVGWIEPHNSYIHILYRAGIVGVLFIIILLSLFVWFTNKFIQLRDIKGILLSSALIYWLIFPNFAVVLELPYFAIPFWCLFGVVLKYANSKIKQEGKNA